MPGGIELITIPKIRAVCYDTKANLDALTGLSGGDLGYATDQKILYRWNGSAWQAITISSRHGAIADIGDPADYPESSLYQADDEEKLYMLVSGSWEYITKIPADVQSIASDVLMHSNDTERATASGSYVKVKECELTENFPSLKVGFSMQMEMGGGTAYGKIYKNGSPIGTERTTTKNAEWDTWTETFSDLVKGDKIQVYAYSDSAQDAKVKDFRFYYSLSLDIENTDGY